MHVTLHVSVLFGQCFCQVGTNYLKIAVWSRTGGQNNRKIPTASLKRGRGRFTRGFTDTNLTEEPIGTLVVAQGGPTVPRLLVVLICVEESRYRPNRIIIKFKVYFVRYIDSP